MKIPSFKIEDKTICTEQLTYKLRIESIFKYTQIWNNQSWEKGSCFKVLKDFPVFLVYEWENIIWRLTDTLNIKIILHIILIYICTLTLLKYLYNFILILGLHNFVFFSAC